MDNDRKAAADARDGAKANAKAELAAYKNADDYRPAEQAELAAVITSYNSRIDLAADLDAVAAALADAKAALDAIKTDARLTAEELAADKAAFDAYRDTVNALADGMKLEGDSDACTALIDEAVAALTGFTYDGAKPLAENKDALGEVLALFAGSVKSPRQAERQEALNHQPCSLCGEHHTGSLPENFIGVIHGIIWIMRSIVLIAA
ncbi:MAG: hypothetical protein IJK89_01830 [Clostridia bacterium]|nr:hypothetical protein [Clostridia bacterium]